MATLDKARREQFLDWERTYAVQQGGKYYEAFLGSKKTQIADQLVDRIVVFAPTAGTYLLLIGHAERAGDPAAAISLSARGMKAIPFWHFRERAALRRATTVPGPTIGSEQAG